MAENVLLTLLWGWPVLLGLFVWLAKASYVMVYMDRLEAWLASTKAKLKSSEGWVTRYWGRPTSVVAFSPFRVTAPISDPFLRSGTRVALVPYVAGAIFIGTFIALQLVIAFGCVFLMLAIWGFVSSLGERREAPRSMNRIRGKRLVKTSFWGDSPTGTCIDEQGRVIKESFWGDSPGGVRIDEDGRIMKQSVWGDDPAGYKVDAEGRLVEEGFFGDTPTGKKIDEDGRIVEEGLFGDTPTGYQFKE